MEVSRLNSSSHSDRIACPDRLGDSNELSSSESAIYERVGRLRESGRIVLAGESLDGPAGSFERYLRGCKMVGSSAVFRSLYGGETTLDDFRRHGVGGRFIDNSQLVATVGPELQDRGSACLTDGSSCSGRVCDRSDLVGSVSDLFIEAGDGVHGLVDLVIVRGGGRVLGTPLESALALGSFLKSEHLLDDFVVANEDSWLADEADRLGLNPVVAPVEFDDSRLV